MNNLMPGDNSAAEPREHYDECRTNCMWAVFDGEFTDGVCPDGHHSHECDCEWIAAEHAEQSASAAAEHLAEIGGSPV